MKNERGDSEIQETLVSGPEHFGEIPEKPEKLENQRFLMKSERGDLEIQETLVSGPEHFGEITEKLRATAPATATLQL